MINLRKVQKLSLIFFLFFITFLFKDYFYISLTNLSIKDKSLISSLEIQTLKRENKELKKELEISQELNYLKQSENYDYIIAKVAIRNPFTFYDTLIIDKGSDDGITSGMAVVNDRGFLGKISTTNKKSSQVDLITKPNNDISIIVHGSYGILSGYSKENECLIISNLNNYNNVDKGDLIYTSGLSNLPGSILIGKVSKVSYDRFQIEKKICVEKSVDLDNLNYVAIIQKRVDLK